MANLQGELLRVSLGRDLKFVLNTTTATGPVDFQFVEANNSADAYYIVYDDEGGIIASNAGASGKRYLRRLDASGTFGSSAGTLTKAVLRPDENDLLAVSTTDFARGDFGAILVVATVNGVSLTWWIPFEVTDQEAVEEQLTAGYDDATAALQPNSLVGRLWTVEKNQKDVLMPRLKRALGLLGEHQQVDGFVYDDDGNIIECRVRIFEDDASTTSAPLWTDTINDADPTSGTLSAGEIARYAVSVSNLLPRNLRTLYRQRVDADKSDNDYGLPMGGSTL